VQRLWDDEKQRREQFHGHVVIAGSQRRELLVSSINIQLADADDPFAYTVLVGRLRLNDIKSIAE
jgi:hypothetical protein